MDLKLILFVDLNSFKLVFKQVQNQFRNISQDKNWFMESYNCSVWFILDATGEVWYSWIFLAEGRELIFMTMKIITTTKKLHLF